MNDCESIIIKTNHILVCADIRYESIPHRYEFEYVKEHFCGNIFTDLHVFTDYVKNTDMTNAHIYLCGDIKHYHDTTDICLPSVHVVENISYNYDNVYINDCTRVNSGTLPMNIYDTGVYFRNIFDSSKNYFELVSCEHSFQTLTESNKPLNALRTGIYLSNVYETYDKELIFNLLRCSSNFAGPTDNFRKTDKLITDRVNCLATSVFKNSAVLNHVLAQIYTNICDNGTNRKAKIKKHSDKTKDMPRNGLIAFVTFYKDLQQETNRTYLDGDMFNYCDRDTNKSILTKMRFTLKNKSHNNNVKTFDIVLYPNSVFIISLETNRLYTHEIIPSSLSVDKIPTRMGYVMRCSNTQAFYKDDDTILICRYGETIKLDKPTSEGVEALKRIYYKENTSDELITYDMFNFSMNNGDYKKPML